MGSFELRNGLINLIKLFLRKRNTRMFTHLNDGKPYCKVASPLIHKLIKY